MRQCFAVGVNEYVACNAKCHRSLEKPTQHLIMFCAFGGLTSLRIIRVGEELHLRALTLTVVCNIVSERFTFVLFNLLA